MANTKEIQDRIKSINDTLKITNAMYMISSSKLKKSKKMLADTEPYFFTLQSEMSRILRHLPDMEDIYFKTNEDKLPEDRKVGYIVITADKGLAGSYNHNILKMAEEHLKSHPNHSLFVLGELGRHYFEQRGIQIEKQFHYTVQHDKCYSGGNTDVTASATEKGRLHCADSYRHTEGGAGTQAIA